MFSRLWEVDGMCVVVADMSDVGGTWPGVM